MSRQDDIQKLILKNNRRLQILKQRQALSGMNAPPEIIIEIEDIEAELEKLWAEFPEIANEESVIKDVTLSSKTSALNRVCFISSEYPPHVLGGLGVHVEKLTTALGDKVDVDVVLPHYKDGYNTRLASRVKPQPLATVEAWYDDPTSWLRFARFAVDKIVRLNPPPQVIHCHDWVTALAGIICRWKLKIPLLFHLHLPNNYPLCASIENLGLVCADLVTVNSQAMVEELKERPFKTRRDVEVVNNGVDINTFRPSQDWPADDGYILFVGRLVEQKGVEYLLRAFSFVTEGFPHISLKIVGEGHLMDGLKNLCADLMIAEKVEFKGWQTGAELTKLYQKAQVVAIPSIYEPFGMTALEAMACQCPVVASRIGGLKEIVDHDTTGFLAEPKDDLDMAQWLMTLLANPQRRHKMGAAGRAFVSDSNYTWGGIAQKIFRFYDSLLRYPMDLSIPAEADEYQQQIINVSQEISPQFKEAKNKKMLEDLFSWRSES